MRKSLATESRVARQPIPSASDKLLISVLESLRRGHLTVDESRAFLVADAIEWIEHAGCKPGGFIQDSVHKIASDFGAVRHRCDIANADQFVDDELHVLQGRRIGRH